jgi:hypothetical protein
MRRFYLMGLAVSLFLAVIISPFACGWEDGLEKVASDIGFTAAADEEPLIGSPIADYSVPGVGNELISTALAGAVGTSLAFAGLFGFAFIITKFRRK